MKRLIAVVAALLPATVPLRAAPVVSTASANISLGTAPLMGVNLSGCEFADDGALCPTPGSVDAYVDKGFRAFRLPFRGAQAADPVVVAKMKAAVARAAERGAYVILDRHDYGATFDPAQAAWWAKFIRQFPDDRHVMIDTMNEPRSGASYQRDPATGRSYATQVNAAIAAFRRAGFKHVLLIEWRGWSGMGRFDKHETSSRNCESPACSFDRAGGLKDPIGRTMVSGHRYPDAGGSGTSATCVTDRTAAQLVANADRGAQARGLKLWLGEFAFGNARGVSPTCLAIGKALVARIKAMPDVYAGVTWWGGGEGWREDYIYKIEPREGTFADAAPSGYVTLLTGR